VTAPGQALVRYSLSGSAPDGAPVSEVIDTGGTWLNDARGASPSVLENGGTGYILVENFGTVADTVTISNVVVDPLVSAEEGSDSGTSANNTAATAVVASAVPFRLHDAQLASQSDVDYVKLTAPAGSTGKHIHVNTATGDPNTDTAVQFFTGNTGATAFDGAAHDDDIGCSIFGCQAYGEDYTTTATITAGQNYWIKVTPGQYYDDPDFDGHPNLGYDLLVWLE
jgi:hypothetical protein